MGPRLGRDEYDMDTESGETPGDIQSRDYVRAFFGDARGLPSSASGLPSSKRPEREWQPGLRRDAHEERPLPTTEMRQPQIDALYQEGTATDSGYVSACLSKSVNDPKSHEELRKYGTIEQAEAQSQLKVDQQTEHTSSGLPYGSDYINDFCNDIYKKLKFDLQKYIHDQARIELPRCLPDLIKAFSIRIGLDTSEPSGAYVMHFLHTHYR